MSADIIKVTSKNKLLAVIIKAKFKQEDINFFVPNEFPLQLAYMRRPKGYAITSHAHNPFLRKIKLTQEVLFIRSGKVRVDFYDERKHYVESRIVKRGDVLFLAHGGHGFVFMNQAEIIEVKQGPFLKKNQPIRFGPVAKNKIRLKR